MSEQGETRAWRNRVVNWSPDVVSLRGAINVPKWFEMALWREGWPAEVVISVSIHPTNGPTLTGIRSANDSGLPFDEAAKLVSNWARPQATLLQWATAEAAAFIAAFEFGDKLTADQRSSDEGLRAARQVRDVVRSVVEPIARPQRRRLVTPELLAEVADVYRTALAAGQAPTQAVERHFTTTHSTAARWVREARKAGVLGQSQGPKAGEATPSE
jgi:hypothetical protein